MRREKGVLISEVFAQYIKDSGLAEGLLGVDVVHAWDDIIGKSIAKYVVNRHFKEGRLICVISSSSARNAISMNKTAYIEKINERLGREVVMEIVLR